EGRPLKRRPAPVATTVVDLMDALRASAGGTSRSARKAGATKPKPKPKPKAKSATPRNKVKKAG
ncbi:hypothetical protein ABTK05_21535, partial [Acinetobacter baumannii]